jgi:hypothetical protein
MLRGYATVGNVAKMRQFVVCVRRMVNVFSFDGSKEIGPNIKWTSLLTNF